MEIDENVKKSMRKWALKCAKRYRFAIPNKVLPNLLRECPKIEGDEKLMDVAHEVCQEVNRMKDKEIEEEIKRIESEDTTVYK